MIERWEELGNVESKSASGSSFSPSGSNDVSKRNASVRCGLVFETPKLARMNEII